MIPVSEPLIGDNVLPLVRECVESGWISSSGRFITEFEERWAAYCGCREGVAVSSGTTALQVATAALKLEPGSEVIVPSFTIISCVIAILEAGYVPVLAECEADTWCLNVTDAEARITPRTRAIMPVHMFGHPVDMRRLMELARTHDLRVVEDAAEAHGAEVEGRRVGGIGDMGCFSFYANKIVTTGEGGMVVTNDSALADRARSLRNLAFRADRRFYHTEIGHNYRLTNLQAAIGVAQVDRIDRHIVHKRWMAAAYQERLSDIPAIALPVQREWARNVYWMYGVVLNDDVPFGAAEFARRLREHGVDSRPFFLGMHEQPVFQSKGLFLNERYPITERLTRRGLYLPSGLTLTEQQIDQVAGAVRKVLA
jgi:perosamine synthetase